jgi:hypothetical protein
MVGMTDTLRDLTENYRQATRALDEAREALIEGIRAAHAAGKGPSAIAREIDHEWTREYVAKVLKG